jgi:hypothetical protein
MSEVTLEIYARNNIPDVDIQYFQVLEICPRFIHGVSFPGSEYDLDLDLTV